MSAGVRDVHLPMAPVPLFLPMFTGLYMFFKNGRTS